MNSTIGEIPPTIIIFRYWIKVVSTLYTTHYTLYNLHDCFHFAFQVLSTRFSEAMDLKIGVRWGLVTILTVALVLFSLMPDHCVLFCCGEGDLIDLLLTIAC